MHDTIYIIYDRLSCRYGNVFSSASDATAERQFKSLFKDGKGMSDFDLCKVANFDLTTGIVDTFGSVTRIEITKESEVPIDAINKNI